MSSAGPAEAGEGGGGGGGSCPRGHGHGESSSGSGSGNGSGSGSGAGSGAVEMAAREGMLRNLRARVFSQLAARLQSARGAGDGRHRVALTMSMSVDDDDDDDEEGDVTFMVEAADDSEDEEEDEEEEGSGDDEEAEEDDGEEEGMECNMALVRERDEPTDSEPSAGSAVRKNAVPADHPLAHVVRMHTQARPALVKYGRSRAGHSQRVNTLRMLEGRQLNVSGMGRFTAADCSNVAQRYVPTDGPTVVDHIPSRCYIGQFSRDGSLFVAAYQNKSIRLYDVDRGWRLRKDVQARNLRWTITDTALSPDQRFLIYASISPVVHLVSVNSATPGVESISNVTDVHEELDLSLSGRDRMFGLWSLQFSSDGREIVGGSNDKSVYIYDLEASKPVLKLKAHDDDVNAVAFSDESSHLFFSGSDDRLCKVWDRRALTRKSKPAGVLVGHTEGVTHIDSKGDGRFLISNAKDQTIKLWDMRKMLSSDAFASLPTADLKTFPWDYRWMEYPGTSSTRHPHDVSLMTYRGHAVLHTLIRAYFSPVASTGQRYIYSGDKNGSVYIYDVLTGERVAKLSHHTQPVRDCSWHPTLPMLASASWDGEVALWEHLRGEQPTMRPLHSQRCPLSSGSFHLMGEMFD